MEITNFNSNRGSIEKSINDKLKGTFLEYIEMKVDKVSEGHIEASIPFSLKVMRPEGNVLDGGLILSMIESVAGIGSMTLLDNDKYEVRGMQVNVNHVRGLTKGRAIATADIIHKGRLTHIWNVNVKSEENKLISTGRVVNIVLSKK